jgi:hypothetical protein
VRVEWEVEPGTRCDVVTYAASNLTGKRGEIRIFPSGSRKGEVHTENLRSMVIRAPFGTRVVLLTQGGAQWEETAWRCVRIVEGRAMPSERGGGLPGVRLPDLDWLDAPDSKRTNPDVQATYPLVERFSEGEGWTFGRGGGLKGRVAVIRVERDHGASEARLHAAERVARAVLAEAARRAPDALPALVEAAASALVAELSEEGLADAAERGRDLRGWATSIG